MLFMYSRPKTFLQEGQMRVWAGQRMRKLHQCFLLGIPFPAYPRQCIASNTVSSASTAPGPGVVGEPSGPAIPTWVHFPSSSCQLVLVRVPCALSSVPHYPWEEDEEGEDIILCVFPQLGQRARNGSFLGKRDCLSAYFRSTLGAAGVPVGKVTVFFLSSDASQGSMHDSHSPIQFYPWEPLGGAF